MRLLQLGYSDLKQRKRQQSNLVVLSLFVLVIVGMIAKQSRMDDQVINIEDTIAASQGHKVVKQAKPSKNDLRKMKVATRIQAKLNFPWHELLAAIEAVKQQADTVKLMAVQPYPSKSEVLISAEAPNLKTMLAFVLLLEEQATLHDVFLVNQRRLKGRSSNRLAFTLRIGWET